MFLLLSILAAVVLAVTAAGGLIAFAGMSDRIGAADVIVVLGSKVELDGRPSVRLQARLDKGADLYRAGLAPVIVVSGGTGVEGYDEAAVMKAYLVEHDLPAAAIIQDSQGYDTYQTARNLAGLARERGWHSVLAVSQFFHLPRTQLALRRFGLQVVYTAHADFYAPRDLYSILREVAAWPSYILRPYE